MSFIPLAHFTKLVIHFLSGRLLVFPEPRRTCFLRSSGVSSFTNCSGYSFRTMHWILRHSIPMLSSPSPLGTFSHYFILLLISWIDHLNYLLLYSIFSLKSLLFKDGCIIFDVWLLLTFSTIHFWKSEKVRIACNW